MEELNFSKKGFVLLLAVVAGFVLLKRDECHCSGRNGDWMYRFFRFFKREFTGSKAATGWVPLQRDEYHSSRTVAIKVVNKTPKRPYLTFFYF